MRGLIYELKGSERNVAVKAQRFHCVYVLGPAKKKVTKVGIADLPEKRFVTLQQNNWVKLNLWAYWWTLGTELSRKVEAEVLRRQKDNIIRGEWMALYPEAVKDEVVSAASALGIELFDDAEAVRKAREFSRSEPAPSRRGFERLQDRHHL